MLFRWLRQSKKTVIFNQNALDQSLLAAIEAELHRQSGRSFSNLCKEALHQYLLSEQGRSSQSSQAIEDRVADLQTQLQSLEQRFFAKEKNRLDQLEAQLQLLTSQVTQSKMSSTSLASSYEISPATAELENTSAEPEKPEETLVEDPLLARIGGLIDDF